MPSSITMLDNDAVVVAYDVHNEDNRTKVRTYLKDTLGAEERTESVYEFVFSGSPTWDSIKTKLESLINLKTDRVYLWDRYTPQGGVPKFRRTYIG